MVVVNNNEVQKFIKSSYSLVDVQRISAALSQQGTFDFSILDNGLFPAAAAEGTESTGYAYVWVRDNVYVAYAHYSLGLIEIAVKNAQALMAYFQKHRSRFEQIIDGLSDPAVAMNRPHVRFNGQTLSEVEENWQHAQNDALGYFLWFYCKLAREGHIQLQQSDVEMLGLFPLYFESVQYWQDEDSGHWEEGRKIEASSIGVVVAGLSSLKQLFTDTTFIAYCCQYKEKLVTPHFLEDLIEKGETALGKILPHECIQPEPKARRYDSALLFLIYPLNVISGAAADQILQGVVNNLQGDYGISRYLGDSFWCKNFFTDLPENIQTSISTEREAWLEDHNRSVQVGEEAQWCIFDPIISAIYGVRFQAHRRPSDLAEQVTYFNRSLGQITGENCRVGKYHIPAWKCPELYYIQDGAYIPNVSTPLLWTQANLMVALKLLEQSLTLAQESNPEVPD